MPTSLLDRPSVYGSRAKLGVIVPSTNTANEAEWNRLAPAGVSVHAARMPLHADTDSDAGRRALYRDIDRFAADLAQASVDVIAYGCTAGSMLSPVAALGDHISAQNGVAALTTAEAIVSALRALQATSVAVATPYHAALNDHERRFLNDQGFRVAALEGLGYGANGPAEYRNIARIDHDTVYALAQRVAAAADGADALLLSCTDLATLALIPSLESQLQMPVISSNSATFWLALRRAGLADKIDDCGTLLANH